MTLRGGFIWRGLLTGRTKFEFGAELLLYLSKKPPRQLRNTLLKFLLNFDFIEKFLGQITIQVHRQKVRVQNLKWPADAFPSWFVQCAEVANKKYFDLMNIIWGDKSWRIVLAVDNFLVLIIESTSHRLQIEFISPQFMDKHLILLIEFVEAADKQFIAVIMYLMKFSGTYILDGVEIGHNISQLY